MTRLIIIRHAESEFNNQNRIQGHKDSSLTKNGRYQVRCLGQRIKKLHIDKIYASDLGRALSTAEEVGRRKGMSIMKDPLLREINLGAWEGMTPQEVDQLYDKGYQRWLKKPSSVKIPHGESLRHFRKRITDRVKEIAIANRGKTIIIVTHGGAIVAMLAQWLKADFDTLLINLQIDNTSLTGVEYSDHRIRLRFINDTAHLTDKHKNDFTIFSKRS